MIWADLTRAALSATVVAAAFTIGLSLPLLIAAGVLLAGIQAVFDPALQAVMPRLAPDPHGLRALNGLFDVTGRLAAIAGSALGAAIAFVAPTIHLLSANSASFLASAGSIAAAAGHRFDDEASATTPPASVMLRLARGWRAARATPGARTILATAGVSYATRSLGFALGVPLLLAQGGATGGLPTLALIMGIQVVGDGLTNFVTVTWRLRDAWRFLFVGYVLRGVGLAAIGAAALFAPPVAVNVVAQRFQRELREIGIPATVDRCRLVEAVAVGVRNGEIAFGAACKIQIGTRAEKEFVVCDSDLSGFGVLFDSGFADTADWMSSFVRKNCF